jgi:tol-pal system protein YbgF
LTFLEVFDTLERLDSGFTPTFAHINHGRHFMKEFEYRSISPLFAAFVVAGVALFASGCGTVQEGMMDDWVDSTPFSTTARLEYRVDSLINENRKLQQQFETIAAENRNLATRNAELDNKVREVGSTPRFTGTPPATPSPTTRSTAAPSGGYEAALTKFRNRDFQGAIAQFKALLNSGISDDLVDNCHYWIGESYFGMRKYKDAIEQFETVAGMKGSDKADDAQYMIGNSYAFMKNRAAAKEAFQKLITMYPSSPLASRARQKIANW